MQRTSVAFGNRQRAVRSPEDPNATLDTHASAADDVRYADCRRRHGHCGLAAEPGPGKYEAVFRLSVDGRGTA
jgi:hypothetical protein